jgi:hypothetical protein
MHAVHVQHCNSVTGHPQKHRASTLCNQRTFYDQSHYNSVLALDSYELHVNSGALQ